MKVLPHMLQPTKPIRGIEAVPFGFDSAVWREHLRTHRGQGRRKQVGAKRNSRGMLWRDRAFYWSVKGYYRAGSGDRRSLQHLVAEFYFGGRVARGEEVWFKDRDRHNFTRANLEIISKAELHRRCMELGEVPKNNSERARKAWETRGRGNVLKARSQTALLLQRFEKGKTHEHANLQLVRPLVAARDEDRRARNRAAYATRRKGARAVARAGRAAAVAG